MIKKEVLIVSQRKKENVLIVSQNKKEEVLIVSPKPIITVCFCTCRTVTRSINCEPKEEGSSI